MQLIFSLFVWAARKITIILFLVITLTFAYFFWSIIAPYIPGIMNWEEQRAQLLAKLSEVEDKIQKTETLIADIEQTIKDTPRPPWYKPWERIKYDAEADLIALGEKLRQLTADKLDIENSLIRGDETTVGRINKYWKMFINTFKANVYRISYVIILVLLGPTFWKIFWFYGFANFAQRAKPVQISSPEKPGHLIDGQTGKTITVTVTPENSLYVRINYMSQYDENLHKRTRLLWKWKAPFISYAAGLFELTQFSIKPNDSLVNGRVVLSSNAEALYLAEICLQDHPGIVVQPRHIVGISGNINVKTYWGITNLHSWLTGQLRYVIFYGTGCLYVEGRGGVQSILTHEQRTRIEEPLVIGFDTRLAYSTARTETFWPYFRGRTLLVDDQFSGERLCFFRQVFRREKKEQTAVERNFQFVMNAFSAIGKFFGF